MSDYRGEREVRIALRFAAEDAGGQRAFAKKHGIHHVVLNRMINGKTRVSDKFARLVGWMRVTEYKRIPPGPGQPPTPRHDYPIG